MTKTQRNTRKTLKAARKAVSLKSAADKANENRNGSAAAYRAHITMTTNKLKGTRGKARAALKAKLVELQTNLNAALAQKLVNSGNNDEPPGQWAFASWLSGIALIVLLYALAKALGF